MSEKYRHWCFTLNNYTQDDIAKLQLLSGKCRYLLYGKEVGHSGTPHLQGFVSFSSPRKVTALHKLFQAHWSVARDVAASVAYCKKDGDITEFGFSPADSRLNQGKRTDLEGLRDAINEGESDRKKLRQSFPGVCARYPNFVTQLIVDTLPAPKLEEHVMREWQSQLCSRLRLPSDARTIEFIVDKSGNGGKSWFTRYYELAYGRSLTILPGKKADMIYTFMSLLKADTKVIFIDAPRSKQGEFIQYDFLEELKNGRVMNTKYESRMIEFAIPHVVVMMNENPDQTKLSCDRYRITELEM